MENVIKVCKRKMFDNPDTMYQKGWNEALETLSEEIADKN